MLCYVIFLFSSFFLSSCTLRIHCSSPDIICIGDKCSPCIGNTNLCPIESRHSNYFRKFMSALYASRNCLNLSAAVFVLLFICFVVKCKSKVLVHLFLTRSRCPIKYLSMYLPISLKDKFTKCKQTKQH